MSSRNSGLVLLPAALLGAAGIARGQDVMDATTLQKQALQVAQQRLDEDWLVRGDGRFIYCQRQALPSDPLGSGGTDGIFRAIIEARAVSSEMAASPISDADAAGGMLWAGVVTYTAALTREYDTGRGWSPWHHTPVTLAVIQAQFTDVQWVVEEESGLGSDRLACQRPDEGAVDALKP